MFQRVAVAIGADDPAGVLGVLVANLDLIAGWCVLDSGVRGLVVALVMAVLSPVMAALGGGDDEIVIPKGGEAR